MTAPSERKDDPMGSNDVALDEFAGTHPQMIQDGSEGRFSVGVAPTDMDTLWAAGLVFPVSLAYRRAATLLSIYRSRIDFLDQCKFESGIRTN